MPSHSILMLYRYQTLNSSNITNLSDENNHLYGNKGSFKDICVTNHYQKHFRKHAPVKCWRYRQY